MTVRTALVIGGGIAGPVTALALRKAGIDATVYESYDRTSDGVGGALMLAPNGLNALRAVEADEAVRAIGQPIRSMVMSDGTGKRLGAFPTLPGLPDGRVLWRSDLGKALREQALTSGIKIEYGKRLVRVEDAANEVTAHFEDGSSAGADVLIGADGIRSTVRDLINPHAPGPESVGLVGLGGVADTVVSDSGAMHFVQGRRAFLGHWTTEDGRGTLWFGNLPDPEHMTYAQACAVPKAEWLTLLRDLYADDVPARDLIRRTAEKDLVVSGSMEIMPSQPVWHRGRMVLVGDSAHAPSPSSGQGASIAVESAVELAKCLRDIPDVPAAFAAYERTRRPRVQMIAAAARKTNDRKAAGPIGRAMMSLLAPIAMRTFLTPQRMFGAAHNYRIDWDERVTA